MYDEDKNTEISKEKTATIALNALQQLFWPHLCGEDLWTVSLNHYHSQKAKEDNWQDIYSSIGLDDE